MRRPAVEIEALADAHRSLTACTVPACTRFTPGSVRRKMAQGATEHLRPGRPVPATRLSETVRSSSACSRSVKAQIDLNQPAFRPGAYLGVIPEKAVVRSLGFGPGWTFSSDVPTTESLQHAEGCCAVPVTWWGGQRWQVRAAGLRLEGGFLEQRWVVTASC